MTGTLWHNNNILFLVFTLCRRCHVHLTILFLILIHCIPSTSSSSPSSSSSSSSSSSTTPIFTSYSTSTTSTTTKSKNTAWSLNQKAREAIQKANDQFQNIPVIVDPNSNKDTQNQKSIFIAVEFLNHVSSTLPSLSGNTLEEDRLVKIGRSLVDLVQLADDDDDDNDDNHTTSEHVLKLGLENIVKQWDILALDDITVS